MKECAGDVSAARSCLGDVGAVRITHGRERQVRLREDRGIVEFMPAKLLARSMSGHIGGELGEAVAEMHSAPGETCFETKQSRHFMTFALCVDQPRTQHHVATALAVDGPRLSERSERFAKPAVG